MKDKNILIQNGVDLNKALDLFGDMEMYNESLGDFMSEIDNKLYKISHFKENHDMANYAILVHSLKSDAKYFGFTVLAEMAFAHEQESKANNTVYVNENYSALINEANKVVAFVREYLASTSGGSETPSPTPMAEQVPESAPAAEPTPEVSISPGMRTILVVDDSEIIVNFVKKILSSDYNVITAADGAEAIRIIESNQNITAMLLDLNMPNVDGFKVLSHMKENNIFDRIPVSVITGNDSKEIDYNAFEYPIIDILKKPFSESGVRSIVQKTIDHK